MIFYVVKIYAFYKLTNNNVLIRILLRELNSKKLEVYEIRLHIIIYIYIVSIYNYQGCLIIRLRYIPFEPVG